MNALNDFTHTEMTGSELQSLIAPADFDRFMFIVASETYESESAMLDDLNSLWAELGADTTIDSVDYDGESLVITTC